MLLRSARLHGRDRTPRGLFQVSIGRDDANEAGVHRQLLRERARLAGLQHHFFPGDQFGTQRRLIGLVQRHEVGLVEGGGRFQFVDAQQQGRRTLCHAGIETHRGLDVAADGRRLRSAAAPGGGQDGSRRQTDGTAKAERRFHATSRGRGSTAGSHEPAFHRAEDKQVPTRHLMTKVTRFRGRGWAFRSRADSGNRLLVAGHRRAASRWTPPSRSRQKVPMQGDPLSIDAPAGKQAAPNVAQPSAVHAPGSVGTV